MKSIEEELAISIIKNNEQALLILSQQERIEKFSPDKSNVFLLEELDDSMHSGKASSAWSEFLEVEDFESKAEIIEQSEVVPTGELSGLIELIEEE